jgi:hypothetical protein
LFFVFWYFSLREKKRKRWLNFLPVGADSKSGATWVSQSVSTSVARVGTGQAIPAVALLTISLARSLARSLVPTNCAFCFGFLLQWELHCSIPGEKHKLVVVAAAAASGRKEGRKEGRKKTTCRITTAAAADRRGSFSKAKETTISLFSLATRGS